MSAHVCARRLCLAVLLTLVSAPGGFEAMASNLTDARPLTSSIIVLHFDDGYIRHHGYHESSEADATVNDPLDLTFAGQLATFSLSSPDDANYATARPPIRIGRKSKGKDFSRKCKWNGQK